MKKIRLIFFLFIVISFLQCSRTVKKTITQDDVLKFIESGTDSTFRRVYFPDQKRALYAVQTKYFGALVESFLYYYGPDKKELEEVRPFMNKENYGHHFFFYSDGTLKKYMYDVGDNHSSYERNYSENGGLFKELGNPFVDEIRISDSKKTTLYFTGVFSDTLTAEISSPSMKPTILKLKKSSMQAKLYEVDFETTESIYYLKISTISKVFGNNMYLDTLRRSR